MIRKNTHKKTGTKKRIFAKNIFITSYKAIMKIHEQLVQR